MVSPASYVTYTGKIRFSFLPDAARTKLPALFAVSSFCSVKSAVCFLHRLVHSAFDCLLQNFPAHNFLCKTALRGALHAAYTTDPVLTLTTSHIVFPQVIVSTVSFSCCILLHSYLVCFCLNILCYPAVLFEQPAHFASFICISSTDNDPGNISIYSFVSYKDKSLFPHKQAFPFFLFRLRYAR